MEIKVLRELKYVGEDRCSCGPRYAKFYKAWDNSEGLGIILDFTKTGTPVERMIIEKRNNMDIILERELYYDLCEFSCKQMELINNDWIRAD